VRGEIRRAEIQADRARRNATGEGRQRLEQRAALRDQWVQMVRDVAAGLAAVQAGTTPGRLPPRPPPSPRRRIEPLRTKEHASSLAYEAGIPAEVEPASQWDELQQMGLIRSGTVATSRPGSRRGPELLPLLAVSEPDTTPSRRAADKMTRAEQHEADIEHQVRQIKPLPGSLPASHGLVPRPHGGGSSPVTSQRPSAERRPPARHLARPGQSQKLAATRLTSAHGRHGSMR
jgi:hypothetical protein